MSEELWMDDRITDENKNYIRSFLEMIKGTSLMTCDLNLVRKSRVESVGKENESIKLDNLNVSEFKVKSKYDEYEINVACYIPKDVRKNSPITIFFHSGGWTLGCSKTYFHSVGLMAQTSKTVWLSVDYRLSPENKYPIPVNDCFSVFEWVAANKAKFSSPNAKLGVCGDSAGGHLAALISNEYSSLLDYQILIYPYLDFSKSYPSQSMYVQDCYLLQPDVIDFFVKNFISHNTVLNSAKISPILKEDFSKLPKTLIIAAEFDPLVDHSKEYFNKLQKYKVNSELVILKGSIHGVFATPVLTKSDYTQIQTHIIKLINSL